MAISNGDEANSNTEVDNVVSYRFNLKDLFVNGDEVKSENICQKSR